MSFLKQETGRSLEQQSTGLGGGTSASISALPLSSDVGTVSSLPTGTAASQPLFLPGEADPAQRITQAPLLSGVPLVLAWGGQVETVNG